MKACSTFIYLHCFCSPPITKSHAELLTSKMFKYTHCKITSYLTTKYIMYSHKEHWWKKKLEPSHFTIKWPAYHNHKRKILSNLSLVVFGNANSFTY